MALTLPALLLNTPMQAMQFIEQTLESLPALTEGQSPSPTLEPPAKNLGTTFDLHGNYWTLVPNASSNASTLYVLPAQAADAWQIDQLSHLPTSKWQWIEADEFGFVWVADAHSLRRLDPHKPEDGWMDISAVANFPNDTITALSKAPSGAILVAFEQGSIAEVDYYESTVQLTSHEAPANIKQLTTDAEGNVWARANDTTYQSEAGPDAWQQNWELVARMPGGSHDHSGALLDGKFYMDWAITADYGYPSTKKIHTKLLAFDPTNNQWSIAADYGRPRGYCGIGIMDGKVWTIAGLSEDADGNTYDAVQTQIFDPKTEALTAGPDLPKSLSCPLALNAAGRIYMLGYPHGKDLKLQVYSIGSGETEWRVEDEGPLGYGNTYGTVLDGKLYVIVPHTYLAIYDPKSNTWETTETPNSTRSPAVGHLNGEVWIMGGRNAEGEDACYIYNPKSKQWRAGPKLPRKLAWAGGFNIDGDLYLTGGTAGGRGYSNSTYRVRSRK